MQERHSELVPPKHVVHSELHGAHSLLELFAYCLEGQAATHSCVEVFKNKLPLHERQEELEELEQVKQLGSQSRQVRLGEEDGN